MRNRAFVTALALMLVMALALPGAYQAQAMEPQPGTVSRSATYTFFPTTALAGTTTVLTDSPYMVGQNDITRVGSWHSADIFVTAVLTPTATMTVTALLSADQANWAAATHRAVIWDDSGDATVTTQVQRLVMTASGTEYFRIPLAGEALKFRIEKSGTVTPTITVTLRNN